MVNKTADHGLGNVELDDLDLGLDANPGLDQPDDREPAVKVTTGFMSGLRDAVTDPNVIRRSVLAALPREYEEAYRTVDGAAAQTAGLYHQVARDLKPAVRDFKRAARQVKSNLDSYLPDAISKRLDEWLKSDPEYKRSQIDAQEAAISSDLAGIFKAQIDAQEETRANQMVGEQLADNRHKTNVGFLDLIQRNLSRLVAYQDSITISYQRKSLELQYRQFYAARDQLELAKGYSAESLTLFRAIQKNTALPDQVKVRGSEILGQLMQENLYGKVQESLVQNTSGFMRQLFDNVTKQTTDWVGGVKDGLTGATDVLDQVSMVDPDAMDGIDKYEMGGRLAGQEAGAWLANRAGQWFKNSRFGKSKTIAKVGNWLGRNNESLPDRARRWAQSPTDDFSILGDLKDFGKSLIPKMPSKQTIGLESLENSATPVPFDKGTRRSIMTIIPGYLARILQSSERNRLQTDDVPLVSFDQTRQEFVGAGDAANRILKRLLPQGSLDSMAGDSERFINKVLGDVKDPELKKKLQTELISRSLTGRGFFAEEYTSANRYKTLSKEDAEKSASLFRAAFSQEGDQTDSNLTEATRLFRRLRQSAPLIENQANAFANTGSLEMLRQLGVVTRVGNRDVINDQFITSLMSGYIGSNRDYEHATGQANSSSPVSTGRPVSGSSHVPNAGYSSQYYNTPVQSRTTLNSESTAYKGVDPEQLNLEMERVIDAIRNASTKDEATKANEVLTQILEAIQTLELSGGGGGPGNDQAIIRKSTVLRGLGKVGRFAWNRAGDLYNVGAWARNKFVGALGVGLGAGVSGLKSLGNWAARKIVEDVYRKGDLSEPALLAYKMKAGHYVNQLTGKKIKTIADIKGPVVDITSGNVVLSGEDFQNGMVNSQGKELVRSGVGWLAGKAGWAAGLLGSTTWKSMTLPFKALSAANWVRKHILMRPSDVYVPGEPTPRLLAVLLLNGGYYSKRTGRPINSVGDIDGDVVDAEGNVKLSLAEFAAGVVDYRGKPIRTMAGRLKGIINTAKDLGVGAAKFVGRQIRRGVNMVGSILSAGGKILTGMSPSVHFGGKFGEGAGPQTEVLIKIHNLLCRHFGEEDQVIDDLPGAGGGFSSFKRMGQAVKGKAKSAATSARDLATGVADRFRSVMAAALGKDESELDGKDTMWERMRKRSSMFRAGSAADLQAKRASKMKPLKEGTKVAPEKSGIAGKLLMAVLGIGGLLKSAVGKLGGLLTSFWELRKVIMAASAAKAGAEAIDALGGLGDVDVDRSGKKTPGGKRSWLRNAISKEGLKSGGRWIATRGALAAGGLLTAGSAVAGGLGTVATGALSALFSAPVLIGAVALGAGYGLYKGYRHYVSGNAAPMQRARFAQYGADPDANSQSLALMEFEELVLPYVTFKSEQANIEGDIDYVSWMEHFGFDPTVESHKQGWGEWYQNRFKPVFLRWVKLTQLTDAAAKVTTLDTSLKDELKAQFIRKTKFARREIQPYPYDVSVVPFLGESAVDTTIIDAEIKAIWDRYRDVSTNKSTNGQMVVKEAGVTTVTSTFGAIPKARTDSASVTMAGQLKYISQGQADASPVIKRSSDLSDFTMGRSRIIDDLTALRVKTFGLTDLDVAKVNVLLDLEESVIKDLKIQPSGQATFDQPVIRYYEEYAGKFGLGATDVEQQSIWQVWFLQRFLPVVLNYVAAVRKVDRTAGFGNLANKLTPTQLLAIAEAVRSAKADVQGNTVSVWNVNASPFVGYPINTDPGSVRGYITSLQNRTTALSYKDPMPFRQEVSATGKDGLGAKGGFMLPKVPGAQMPVTQAQRSAMAPKPVFKDLVSQTPTMISGSGDGGTGTYREIPRPKGSGTWTAVKDTIIAAAKAVGVDPALLGAMAKIESTFDTNAVNPSTGAAGMFQFLDSTWRDMQKLYGEQYGVPANASPTDPVAASIFAANYVKWNMDRLSSKVARPLTATDLYAAHFLGHAGAGKLLRSDPNAIAAEIFPGPARTNPKVFYRGGRPIAIAELYQWLDKRVSGEIPPDFLVKGSASGRSDPSVLEANGLADPNAPVGNVGGMTNAERESAAQQKPTPVTAAMRQTSKVPSITMSTAYAGTIPVSGKEPQPASATPQESPAQRDARIDADVKLRTQQTQRQQIELARASEAKTDDQLSLMRQQLATQQGIAKSLEDILAAVRERVASKTEEPKIAAVDKPKSPISTSNPRREPFPLALNRQV